MSQWNDDQKLRAAGLASWTAPTDGLTVEGIHSSPDGAFNLIRSLQREVERLEARLKDFESDVVREYLAEEAWAGYRKALQEIAAGEHGLRRPAGAIARAALAGDPLPGWDR